MLLSFQSAKAMSMDDSQREALIAALLLKFASYTQWQSDDSADAPFLLCLPEGFSAKAIQLLELERVKGRSVVVVTYRDWDQVDGHLVMIDRPVGDTGEIPNLLRSESSLLIVGIGSGYWESGGVIHLFFEGEKPVFEVHLGNAKRARIKISARMLQLASRIIR
jgi:hypothetical protein